MKLNINRYSIDIVPESVLDIAYVEEVLGLKTNNDYVLLVRKNKMGLDSLGYLETQITVIIKEP